MTHKYGQELPKDIEDKLDSYIERIKNIKWFTISESYSQAKATKQIKLALKCFGVEAKVEYRSLKTAKDWGAARGANLGADWGEAWDAAMNAAMDATFGASRGAAMNAARGATFGASRGAAMNAARGAANGATFCAAWDATLGAARSAAKCAARGAAEINASDLPKFNKKYPKGAFLQLIPLWEMGLYPCGVIDGKFICYVPTK